MSMRTSSRSERSWSRLMRETTQAMDLPSGEICGSETVVILVKSSSWSVRVCAETEVAPEAMMLKSRAVRTGLNFIRLRSPLRRLASGKFTLFCGARMLPCVRRRVNRGDEKPGYFRGSVLWCGDGKGWVGVVENQRPSKEDLDRVVTTLPRWG